VTHFCRPHAERTSYERAIRIGSNPLWKMVLCAGLHLSPTGAIAQLHDPTESARIYVTREERRKAGGEHRFTDWLVLSSLAEAEYVDERFRLRESRRRSTFDDLSKNLQLGLVATPTRWLKAELLYELDSDRSRTTSAIDEAIVSLERSSISLDLGRMHLPFGVYISHFATGPLLEFGDTRADALVFSYEWQHRLELAGFVYSGRAHRIGGGGAPDFGLALEYSPPLPLHFGMSVISDLADSSARLLREQRDRYRKRVDAASLYAIGGLGPFEASAEFVGALRRFEELESNRARPRAWNVELAWYPVEDVAVALRWETSRELDDAPHRRSGIALSWRFLPSASVTLDYLHARFNRGFGHDAKERDARSVQQISAQLTVAF